MLTKKLILNTRINACIKIINCVINDLKNRFFAESLRIGVGVDNLIKLKYGESIELLKV